MSPVRSVTTHLVGGVACAILIAACGGGEERDDAKASNVTTSKTMNYEILADFVSETDSLPRLRYRHDGQVTLNDRCPVRLVKLNPKMSPAYVNGRPVGFC